MRTVAALLLLAACTREPTINLAAPEDHAAFYSTRAWQYEYRDRFDGDWYVEGLDSMTGRLDLQLGRDGDWRVTAPDSLVGYFWEVPYTKADTLRKAVTMFDVGEEQDGFWTGTEHDFTISDPDVDSWLDSYCEAQRPEQTCRWERQGNRLTTTMAYADSLVVWWFIITWERDSVR